MVAVVAGETAIGARIRDLRGRSGKTANDLADKLGISPPQVSRLESGERLVKAHELPVIAEFLGTAPSAILNPGGLVGRMTDAALPPPSPTFQSTVADQMIAIADLHELLAKSGFPHHSKLTDIPPDFDTADIIDHARNLARWASTRFDKTSTSSNTGWSPFERTVHFTQKVLGVETLVERHDHDHVRGAAIVDPSFHFIFVNAKYEVRECLFILAHELGHVLYGAEKPLILDADLAPSNDAEKFANTFAANFLMPELRIQTILGEESNLGARALARMLLEFGVDFTSLIDHLRTLGVINNAGHEALSQVGDAGLLRALQGHEQTDKDLRAGLVTYRRIPTPVIPPIGLTSRAGKAWDDGVISIRPLASLLGEDPEELLMSFTRVDKGAVDLEYSIPDRQPEPSMTSPQG